jgi:N4-gp56 family major capsid protein
VAYTSFAVNDTFAVKLWSKMLIVAEREALDIAPLIGSDDNSVIQMKTEPSKGSGDTVTFGLRARMSQDGITEGETAEGNAESLSIYSDAVVINELGFNAGVKSVNTIDAQRVPFDLRQQARDGLGELWADRKSISFFNQVCGNNAETRTKYTGLNPVTAPTSARRITAGTGTVDENITSTDVFTLDLIDQAVELAKVGNNMVRPIRIGGQPKYVLYLHPYQVTSMRTNSSTGQWLDIQKAAMMGGQVTSNPIYTGALGEYNGVIIRQSQDVTNGVNSSTAAAITTVRRAVLLGAQAAVIGYGQANYGPMKYRWNEELLDHKRKLEVSAWSIWGMKKTIFNSADFGTVVISTFAQASS